MTYSTRTVAVVLSVLFLAVAGSYAQTDVKGWGKLNFDMTLSQIKTEYAGYTIRLGGKDQPYVLEIKAVDVGGVPVDVVVEADYKTGKITEITLNPNMDSKVRIGKDRNGNSTVPIITGATLATRSITFEKFKSMLIRKYVSPTNEERQPSYSLLSHVEDGSKTTLRWRFPSTTIELEWDESLSHGIGFLVVSYSANHDNGM